MRLADLKRIAVVGNWEKPGAARALEIVQAWGSFHGAVVESNLPQSAIAHQAALNLPRRNTAADNEGDRGHDAAATSADLTASPRPEQLENLMCVTPLAGSAWVDERTSFGGWDEDELAARYAGSDLLITLGGDGTLLYAVRFLEGLGAGDRPMLAVNLGTVGFNTQAMPGELEHCLDAIREERFRLERRLMLEVQLESGMVASAPRKTIGWTAEMESTSSGAELASPRTLALNDVVVAKSAWGHMVHLSVEIDGQPASNVDADSLVLATPTGSSGYNYAAGGPVVVPWLEAVVMNAICPHRHRLSPVVLSPDVVIGVRARRRESAPPGADYAQILVDGQPWCTLAPGALLKISRAPLYLPLVVFRDDFFDKLRERLRWGGLT